MILYILYYDYGNCYEGSKETMMVTSNKEIADKWKELKPEHGYDEAILDHFDINLVDKRSKGMRQFIDYIITNTDISTIQKV